jgi:hypothetical protein
MTSVTATVVDTRRVLQVSADARLTTRAALAGLVAALVLGILGMHALANHGTPAASMASAMASADPIAETSSHKAVMAPGASRNGHEQAASTTHSSPATAAASGTPAGSGHDMTGTVMLCVVMLAAAALTLVGLLAGGVLRPLLPDAFKPAAVRERTVQWVRGTGPPPVWQFSVIRC